MCCIFITIILQVSNDVKEARWTKILGVSKNDWEEILGMKIYDMKKVIKNLAKEFAKKAASK